MKTYIKLLLLFGIPLLTLAQHGPLTVQNVITLAQLDVSPDEILRKICSAPAVDFNMIYTNEALSAGVSVQAIKLMATREKGLHCNGPQRSDPGPREALIVPQDTQVRLRLTRNLSSAHTREDDLIDFEVLKDVLAENQNGKFLIVKRGAPALGTITEANPKRSIGQAGTVQVTIDSVTLANGDKIALYADTKNAHRSGHVGLVAGLTVPVAFVYVPKDPFWTLTQGKESVIKDGLDFMAKTLGEADLNSLDFEKRK